MENSSFLAYEKIESVAHWVGMSVVSAFFASLESCSCINLSTSDVDDDNDEEAKERPLMLTNAVVHDSAQHHDIANLPEMGESRGALKSTKLLPQHRNYTWPFKHLETFLLPTHIH